MSEWFMEAVLKTVGRKARGFESLSLRSDNRDTPSGGGVA